MSSLTLSLRPRRPISTVLEAPEFALLLGNPGRVDLPLHRRWFAGARVSVTHPDGRRSELRPFGELGPEGPADDEIFERSERERRFVLTGAVAPGTYVLEARLAGDPSLVASTSWFLEPPAPVEAALTIADGAPAGQAWLLAPGSRGATLLSAAFGLGDESSPEPARLTRPDRVAVADASARGLVAAAHAGPPVRRRDRVAWLSGQDRLHLGSTAALFDVAVTGLPGAARRIVGPALVDDAGGCGLAVLSADGRELWLLRAAPAVSRPAPTPPAVEPEDDLEDMVEETDDDAAEDGPEEVFKPSAEVPPATVVARLELPFAATRGAAALGRTRGAVVVAGDVDGGIELVHVVLDGAGGAAAVGRARIAGARTIAGCDPWLAVDERGVARLYLLFEEPGEDGPAVAAAKIAFDDGARPLYVDGIERRRLAALAGSPVAGAAIVVDAAAWSLGWCVQAGDRLVGALPGQQLRERAIAAASELRFALANEGRIAAALASPDGLSFVAL